MDTQKNAPCSPSQATPAICTAVEALRRRRHTSKQIIDEVGVLAARVSRILRRVGHNRLSELGPAKPVRRYERAAPGEIVHIDIQRLDKYNRVGHRITVDRTRGVGWEYVHLVTADHSRLAYSEILPNEKRASWPALPLRFFPLLSRSLGVKIRRVMVALC
jgi:hypothetical protein